MQQPSSSSSSSDHPNSNKPPPPPAMGYPAPNGNTAAAAPPHPTTATNGTPPSSFGVAYPYPAPPPHHPPPPHHYPYPPPPPHHHHYAAAHPPPHTIHTSRTSLTASARQARPAPATRRPRPRRPRPTLAADPIAGPARSVAPPGRLAPAPLSPKTTNCNAASCSTPARGDMVQCTQPPPQLKLPESKITELTDDENHVSQVKPVADIELSGLQPHRLLQTIEKSPGGGSQCSLHEEIPTDANAIADAAWEALKRSIDMPEGAALNYDQVLMRDFIPSVLAFLMKGEHLIAKKILVETAVLIVGPLKLGANCKVHPHSPTQKAESLLADFGETEKHLDSALWWISLLHAYTERTGDNSLAKSFDCKRAMQLILMLCLSKDLNSYSIDTHNLFLMAMKCALRLLKQDSDADFVNRIKERIQDLIYNLHSYHWLDLQRPIGTNTRTTLNKSNVPLESLPNWINLSRSRGGYFIGNVSPGIMDFHWFCLGNFIAILSSVVTREQAEAILNLVEENLEWLSGCDLKNTRWSYHNGGSWSVLSWPLVAVSVKLGRLHLAQRAVELMEQQLANEGFPKYYDGKTQQYGVADYLVARSILDDPSHRWIVTFKEKYWNITDFELEEFLKWIKNDESNRLIEKKESEDFDFGDIIHYCRRKVSFLVNLKLYPIKYGTNYRVIRTHQRGSTIYRWHNAGGHSLGDISRTTLKLHKGPDPKSLRPVDDSMVLYEFRETEGPKEKVLWKFEMKDDNSEVSSVINTLEDEIKTLKVESVEEQMQRRVKELELENAEKDRQLKKLELENAEKDKCLRKLEIDYEHMKDQLGKKIELFNEGELLRKKLHNQIMDLKGHMRVFCRVRPLFGKEATVVTHPTPPTSLENAGREIQLIEKGKDVLYKFDKVFDSAASQEAIFKDIAELVQSALDGHKITIFSYGQTGSSKTYTMIGKPNDEEEGMIPRAFKEIFRCIKSWEDNGWIYEVKASMLEIYCEKISDLLDNHKPCDIYDCEGEDVVLHITDKSKLEEKLICTAEKAYKLFEVASKCRTVGKTHMNDESSRSHFFFKLKINGYNKLSSEKVEGVLQMIDLAGSETCTDQTSDTQKRESKDINTSLLALTRLFGAIGRGDEHLPYRASKLTRLLQGYFTGDSKILMFINIAPELSCIGTTKKSLNVGCDVNNCKIKRKTENHKQQQKSDEVEESHMTHYKSKSKKNVTKEATVTKLRARGVQFGTSIKSPAIGRIGSCSKKAPIDFRR